MSALDLQVSNDPGDKGLDDGFTFGRQTRGGRGFVPSRTTAGGLQSHFFHSNLEAKWHHQGNGRPLMETICGRHDWDPASNGGDCSAPTR